MIIKIKVFFQGLAQLLNGMNNPVQIERRIGKINQKNSKVSKYYKVVYQHREFSYTISSNTPKRLINNHVYKTWFEFGL